MFVTPRTLIFMFVRKGSLSSILTAGGKGRVMVVREDRW